MGSVTMNFRWIVALIAFSLFLCQAYSGEPLRAGIDVPEPTIIRKVEVPNPLPSYETALVGLSIIIDEQGAVTGVKVGQYDSALVEAAKSSVWKWRFSPTLVNGKAVPITATVVILFSTGQLLPTVDLGTDFIRLLPLGNTALMCTFSAVMDRDGNIKEEPDGSVVVHVDLNGNRTVVSRKEDCGKPMYFELFPESAASFSRIEEKMKMQGSSAPYLLRSSRYIFPDSGWIRSEWIKYVHPGLERLYYSVMLVSNGSQLFQLAGVDSDVQPPKFDVDFSRFAESLRDARYRKGAVYFFRIFVDENGRILGIDNHDIKNEAVLEALSKATVITPGTLNGKPVPTAVILAIPVR
jgi:hypothetical protein